MPHIENDWTQESNLLSRDTPTFRSQMPGSRRGELYQSAATYYREAFREQNREEIQKCLYQDLYQLHMRYNDYGVRALEIGQKYAQKIHSLEHGNERAARRTDREFRELMNDFLYEYVNYAKEIREYNRQAIAYNEGIGRNNPVLVLRTHDDLINQAYYNARGERVSLLYDPYLAESGRVVPGTEI